MKTRHYDFATPQDATVIARLWKDAFGQPAEDANFFFKNRFRPGDTLVYREEGIAAAMLTLIPARLGVVPGAMLYSGATNSKFRNQGIFAILHDEALAYLKEQGSRFVCVVPRNEEEMQRYLILGYEPRFYRTTKYYPSMTPCPYIQFKNPDAVEFAMLRAEYYSRRTRRLRLLCPEYLLADLRHYGGEVVTFESEGKKAYVAYTIEDQLLHIREMNVSYSPELGASLLSYTGCKEVAVDTDGRRTIVGLYKPLGEDPLPKDFLGHLSLCLDD